MGTNTGIGIGIGIPFRNNALGGDNIYFPPELKARMIGVWDNYGKKNTDADRNIIKNKIPNAGGDLKILNSAYKLNSGFGEYREDFTSWIVSKEPMTVEKTDSQVHISYIGTSYKELPMFEYSGPINENYSLTVEIQGILNNVIGKFIHNNGFTQEVTNGINTIKFSNSGSWYGFTFYREDNTIIGDCNITIKQIPAFEGALVTDGINDIIASIKTLEDWNIGNKGITIVSMIHQINTNTNNFITTNNIRTDNKVVGRNTVSNIGKTGIYGWYKENIQSDTINVINNILGDKNDYISHSGPSTNINPINNSKFYVQGYAVENGFTEISSIAHYWTFAVLGKATEDEINLIIGNYNLDRSLKPDILCNIGKQGITNDNHADFNDRLIDYSGNGRDIQMYNLAWKGGSGIAAKQYETFKDWTSESSSTSIIKQIDEFTRIVESTTNGYWVSRIRRTSDLDKVYEPINIYLYQDNNFLIHECKYKVDGVDYTIPIYESVGKGYHQLEIYSKDRYIGLPENAENIVLSEWYYPKSTKGSIKYSIIPSCKGGIILDGIEDFGKVTGMPIYKDYTFISKYQRLSYREAIETEGGAVIASKSYSRNQGAFIFNGVRGDYAHDCYSFGLPSNNNLINDKNLEVYYQTKYTNQGKSISSGTAADSDILWLGTVRDNDNRFINAAIYSLMSFPYSMSEFLIERQLKKHKLGTLYPDMVEFRPIIKANANYNIFYTALLPLTGIVWERINIGDYVPVGRRIAIQMSFDNEDSELVSAISSQLGNISITKNSNNKGYTIFGDILKNKSPQKINITIDEYIRYEDIVQPYPVLLRFNDENGNEVSWGGKFRIGSTITRIGSAADSNLLPNIYNIFGLLLNDNQVTSSKVIVEKTMVFKAKSSYIFDNNEPKCILSPKLLRIPNSSYKILGHIPDISGHGNHGVIHNSAYAEMSGANGYPYDYRNSSFWCDSVLAKVVSGELIEYFAVKNSTGFSNITSGVYKGEIKVTGVTKAISENKISRLRIYTNSTTDNELIDITQDGNYNIDIKGVGDANRVFFYAIPNNPNESIVVRLTEPIYIEQVDEYEGAYCLDGVDDFVTIPTTVGGKQVLMKVNWQKEDGMIYNQNPGQDNFAIFANDYNGSNVVNAYASRNNGSTYIDGILNNNILATQLKNVTHNITITNENVINNTIIPVIGANAAHNNFYSQMALYDFMLFDEISTDDKIKELNEYVGIEAKVELPPYYWDAYGKTNLDADKATIQQRGVAVGNYDLTNYNHAYDNMSGYGGYSLERFDKSWSSSNNTSVIVVSRNPYDITLKKLGGNSDWEFNNTELKVISNPVSVKFKSNKNIKVTCDYHYYPVGGNSEGTPLRITSKDLIANKDAIITISPISQENIDKYNIDVNRGYYLIYFQLSSTLAVNEEVTIEMLPLYPNALLYDGVTDYSENNNIPALTDYTYIFKRELLNNTTDSCSLYKGDTDVVNGQGFVTDYISQSGDIRQYSFGGYVNVPSLNTDKIIYGTKTSANGIPVSIGSGIDTVGMALAKWKNVYRKMVFYKLILYPKTIPLLQINFLKNLMERDEIIDLTNPIFKNESNAL